MAHNVESIAAAHFCAFFLPPSLENTFTKSFAIAITVFTDTSLVVLGDHRLHHAQRRCLFFNLRRNVPWQRD